jgi:DNA repair exonuclease SbcCD nuclease subunit
MYAWQKEAGGDYDLARSEKLLTDAFVRLSSTLPEGGQALVAFLGDLFHYDGMEPVTPAHKNLLDADGRYPLMVRTGIRLVRRVLGIVLARHEQVHVVVQAGNHDPSSAIFLAECLAAVYDAEPRLTVDVSPRQFHYVEHGRNLIGVCHGHEVKKLEELPIVMAQDRPEAWGRTRYRTWLTGHVHRDRVVDASGVRVESFRVLPPTDAWADSRGYRGAREMKALLLHADHGEVQRVTVNPEMFNEDRAAAAPRR